MYMGKDIKQVHSLACLLDRVDATCRDPAQGCKLELDWQAYF